MIHFFLYSWDDTNMNAFLVEEKRGGFIKQGNTTLYFSTKEKLWDYAIKKFANKNYVHYELQNKNSLGDE